jgi:hypothetical protein
VRTERKKKSWPKKNSIKDPKANKHPRSTIKCREESKKRQRERENTQIVPTKQAARKSNFHIFENGFNLQSRQEGVISIKNQSNEIHKPFTKTG